MDPNQIQGYTGAKDPTAPKEPERIDKEKFKKVMAVDSSADAEKRGKRKFKQSEEEGELDESARDVLAPLMIPVVESTFSEYMDEGASKGGAFAADSVSSNKATISGNLSDAEGYDLSSGSGLERTSYGASLEIEGDPVSSPPSSISSPPPSITPPPPPNPISPSEEPAPLSTSSQVSGISSAEQETGIKTPSLSSPPDQTTPRSEKKAPKEVLKKPSVTLPSYMKESEKKESLKEKRIRERHEELATKKGTESPSTAVSAPKKKESPSEGRKKVIVDTRSTKSSPESLSSKTAARSDRSEGSKLPRGTPAREYERTGSTRSPIHFETDERGKKQEEKEKGQEALSEITSLPITTPPIEMPIPIEAPTPTAATFLSKEVYDLFEKMVGMITVHRSTGLTQTTVVLNMKGSVFHGSELVIKQYGTALNSYEVQLQGSPEAVSLFNANMADLVAAIQSKEFRFEIRLQRPILKKEFQAVNRKREGDSGSK